jgi:hypothetical protein
MPGGRPTLYNLTLATRICQLIAKSDRGLVHICAAHDDLPERQTVLLWLTKHPEFVDMYAQAKEAQADFMLEQTSEIADDGSADYKLTGKNGTDITIDQEALGRSRLRVETRLKVIEKLAPRKYGAMSRIELSGHLNLSAMTDEDILEELQRLQASGVPVPLLEAQAEPEEPEDGSDLV